MRASPQKKSRTSSKQHRVHLRLADLSDVSALSDLLTVLFSQEVEFQPNMRRQRSGLRIILNDPKIGRILVAEKEGQVIGMASLLFTISTALGGRVGILEDVVVMPDLRGQGIGKQLVQYALAHARRIKLKRLTLLTDGDNQGAQRLYKKFGFQASKMLPMRLPL